MSLVATINKLVQDVLTPGKALGDIPVTVTYRSGDVGNVATFNPETQTVTANVTDGTPVYAVFARATERQIDGVNVLRNDRFYYISNQNLINAGITSVKPNDRILQDGIDYKVMNADPDPTYSLWIIHARKP